MKVLHVTTNYPTQSNPAFGIFMKEQTESLEPFGVENTIFFSNGSECNQEMKYGGAVIHIISVFKIIWHLLFHRYDLIHCHSNISGIICVISGAWLWNKCILSFQNDPDLFEDARYFKKLYPFFNKIIVKKHTKFLDREKVVYLPNGCNEYFFHPMNREECKKKLHLNIDKRYILFVDSNTSRKRVQKRKDRFDAVLEILRKDYGYKNIEELVMIGVSRDMVPTYMNACDLHLLTSDHEGSPNSVKECIMCNVPVVSTNVGNVKEMIGDIDSCYVAENDAIENLAADVDMVLKSQIQFRGRDLLLNKGFGIDIVANKLLNIYKEVLNKE